MSLYDELGVEPDATPEEIKRAGREAAKRNHPDKGGDPAAFDKAQRALAILRDPAKRAKYDRDGDEGAEADNDPVLALVMAAFEAALAQACRSPRYTDISSIMRAQLLNGAAAGEDANRSNQEAIIQLQEVARRLRFKGEGRGPFATLVASRIILNERNIAENVEKISAHRAAAEFVARFLEYPVDERTESPFTIESWGIGGIVNNQT